MNILQLLFFTSLSVFFCNRVWGQCWQGRTFSESVVSPELRSSSILRLPDVPTLARCAKACCELQGCDLAWFFQQRCYVLSCQNTENCKPKQRPGMDSILVFLERESQQRLVLQSLVRGESFPNPKLRQPLPRHRGNENPMKDLALLEGIQNLDNSLETYQNSEDRRAGDRASGAVEQDLMYDWPANQGKEDFNQSETEKVNDPLTTIPAPPESSTFPQSYLSEMSNESKTYEKKPNATASLTTNMMDEEDSQKILSITPIHDISQASSTEPTSVSAVRDLFVSPGNIEEMQEMITEEPVRVLTVSIKGPVEVTLPQNTIELTASINPNDSKEFTPTYEWIRVTSPDGQNGLIEGQNNQSVRLAKLSAGFYVIRVIIKAQRAYGESSLNITIHPAVNISKPPKAVTVPKTQEVLFQEASICFINGSQSVGDAGIFSYLWEKVDGPFWKADGPIDTDVLQLKNLSLGEYTFKLTVWDSDGQNDSSTASVIVSNPKDDPPQARAGTDRVITLPLNQLILWGNESSDDHGITHYLWTLHPTSPSHKVTMKEVTSPSLKLSDLQEGRYLFQLTVTDSRGQQDSDTISVTVLPARILSLVAHSSGSHTLMLPNNSLVLRGSVSNSGPANVSFLWVRDEQSPAAGEVLYGSDHEASLYLTNLIEGTYLFQLHVTDVQGHSSTAIATVEVQPDPREREEVELELQVGVAQVSQRQKDTVVRQLAALLHVLDSDIALKPLHGQSDISTVFRFSVLGPDGMIPGPKLARLLRNLLLREKTDFLLFRVLRVDIVMCLLLCSGHGQCDPITKSCSCDPLWMENPIQRLLFDGESNCDWSVLYVTICSFLTIVFLLSLGWMFISCCKSEKRTKLRKKTRYTILDNMDEQERMELQPKYNIKHRSTEHNSSLMMSESELESEQDNIFSNQRSSEKTHNRMRNVDNFSLCPVES